MQHRQPTKSIQTVRSNHKRVIHTNKDSINTYQHDSDPCKYTHIEVELGELKHPNTTSESAKESQKTRKRLRPAAESP